jgi:hypothetical protein
LEDEGAERRLSLLPAFLGILFCGVLVGVGVWGGVMKVFRMPGQRKFICRLREVICRVELCASARALERHLRLLVL